MNAASAAAAAAAVAKSKPVILAGMLVQKWAYRGLWEETEAPAPPHSCFSACFLQGAK